MENDNHPNQPKTIQVLFVCLTLVAVVFMTAKCQQQEVWVQAQVDIHKTDVYGKPTPTPTPTATPTPAPPPVAVVTPVSKPAIPAITPDPAIVTPQ